MRLVLLAIALLVYYGLGDRVPALNSAMWIGAAVVLAVAADQDCDELKIKFAKATKPEKE